MRVRARVCLFADAQGQPRVRRRRYRPNHNLGPPENRQMFIGQIDLAESGLQSGEAADLIVDFVETAELEAMLRPGLEWRIQEGGTLVGAGTVLEVLE
jgi:hypothetical protein